MSVKKTDQKVKLDKREVRAIFELFFPTEKGIKLHEYDSAEKLSIKPSALHDLLNNPTEGKEAFKRLMLYAKERMDEHIEKKAKLLKYERDGKRIDEAIAKHKDGLREEVREEFMQKIAELENELHEEIDNRRKLERKLRTAEEWLWERDPLFTLNAQYGAKRNSG